MASVAVDAWLAEGERLLELCSSATDDQRAAVSAALQDAAAVMRCTQSARQWQADGTGFEFGKLPSQTSPSWSTSAGKKKKEAWCARSKTSGTPLKTSSSAGQTRPLNGMRPFGINTGKGRPKRPRRPPRNDGLTFPGRYPQKPWWTTPVQPWIPRRPRGATTLLSEKLF